MKIRKYKPEDRKAVEHIHYETGFVGSSMKPIFTNKKLYAKQIAFYVKKTPNLIWVAEEKKKVVGYLFGCLNDKEHNEVLFFFKNLFENLFRAPFENKRNRTYMKRGWRTLFNAITRRSGEFAFKTPKNAGHLHINFLPEARGKEVGSKLLKEFFTYAKKQGVKTIHADSWYTSKNPNESFWKKNGFKVYSEVHSTAWQPYLKEVKLRCYVKKL